MKQSLDPARFAHYHPRIAVALSKIEAEFIDADDADDDADDARDNDADDTDTRLPTRPTDVTPRGPRAGDLVCWHIGMAGWGLWWRATTHLS